MRRSKDSLTGRDSAICAILLNCAGSMECTCGSAWGHGITAKCAMEGFPIGCSRRPRRARTTPCTSITSAASTVKSRSRCRDYFGRTAVRSSVCNWRTNTAPAGREREPTTSCSYGRLAREVGLDAPFYTITGWDNAALPARDVLPLFGGYADGFWWRSLARPAADSKLFLYPNPLRRKCRRRSPLHSSRHRCRRCRLSLPHDRDGWRNGSGLSSPAAAERGRHGRDGGREAGIGRSAVWLLHVSWRHESGWQENDACKSRRPRAIRMTCR